MNLIQGKDSKQQHVIVIEKDGEFRLFFKWHNIQTATTALSNLRRDIANHGESTVDFKSLPLMNARVGKSGKAIYDLA